MQLYIFIVGFRPSDTTDGAVERTIPVTIEAIDKTTISKKIEERETACKSFEKNGHYYLKVSLMVVVISRSLFTIFT